MINNIFDSHAHYDDEQFDGDRDELIASLPSKGVCAVINCASDLKSSATSAELSEKYPFFWCACGIHPHEAEKELKNANISEIEQKIIDIYKNNFYSGNIFIKKYISTLLRRIHSFNLFGEPF